MTFESRNEPPMLFSWTIVARAPMPPPRSGYLSVPWRALWRHGCSLRGSTRCSRLRRRTVAGGGSAVAGGADAGSAPGGAVAGGELGAGAALVGGGGGVCAKAELERTARTKARRSGLGLVVIVSH